MKTKKKLPLYTRPMTDIFFKPIFKLTEYVHFESIFFLLIKPEKKHLSTENERKKKN